MHWLRRFVCHTLGWHFPTDDIRHDGASYYSQCKHCNRRILKDSQGNWFAIFQDRGR